MNIKSHFIEIKYSNKIWAVGSIHSNFESFSSIKEYLLLNFCSGDKLVFLGNIIGLGKKTTDTLSSVIDLRNNLLSKLIQLNIFEQLRLQW